MMTAELPEKPASKPPESKKAKRRAWMPFWRLPVMPLCPEHGVPMIVNGTQETAEGLVIQWRKCPCCDARVTTTYRR